MNEWSTFDDIEGLFGHGVVDPLTSPGPSDGVVDDTDDKAPFHRILVPIDATDSSLAALPAMLRFSESSGFSVRLVHVRVWDPATRGRGRLYLETAEEATTLLDGALTGLRVRNIQASGLVVNAPRRQTAAAILAEVAAWRSDVIVMASRPRRLLTAMLMGSVSQRVVREARCPVLIIHPSRG